MTRQSCGATFRMGKTLPEFVPPKDKQQYNYHFELKEPSQLDQIYKAKMVRFLLL